MFTRVYAASVLRLFVIATVALATVAARADSPVRWKFKPGETLNYVLERGADGKMKLSGSEFAIKMGMVFDTTWKVKSVAADGTADLEQTIDRIQITMASPLAGNISYDSSTSDGKPAAGPVAALMQPMIDGMLGQTFTLKVSPLGKVSDITLPEKLVESFAKQKVSENRRGGMGIGGNAFSEKGIKELIEKAVLPLPDGEKSWSQSFSNEVPFLGTETAETTYSFDGNETVDGKQLAKIAAKTELTFEPAENPRAELEITEQDSTGTFLFDAETGHLVKSSGTQTAVKEITGQQEVTQDIKETTAMYLGKSPAAKPAEAAGKEAPKDAKPAAK